MEQQFLDRGIENSISHKAELMLLGIELVQDAVSRGESAVMKDELADHLERLVAKAEAGDFLDPDHMNDLDVVPALLEYIPEAERQQQDNQGRKEDIAAAA